MLQAGEPAPDFSLPSSDGTTVSLKSLRGRKVVLYFYPKDNTPGCTKEACSFRDNLARVRSQGAVIYGVSADSLASHAKFIRNFSLNFPLLSDEEKTVLKAYGVWKRKSFMGRTYMGIERTTVLIDEEGKVIHVFPKVKVLGHTQEVLAKLSRKDLP